MDAFISRIKLNPRVAAALVVAAVGVAGMGHQLRKLLRENATLRRQLEVLAELGPAVIPQTELPESYTNDSGSGSAPSSSSSGAPGSSGESKSSGVIEHDKPLAERTYEQVKLRSEYLLMHFGEALSGNFRPGTDGSVGSGNALNLDVGTGVQSDFGDFSTFDFATGKNVAPQYPRFALDFPTRVAKLALHFAPAGAKRALDVGCAVGRTAFELTPKIDEVVGVDYSHMFIDVANRLAGGEEIKYTVPIEGSIVFSAQASLGPHVRRNCVKFLQGDATRLAPSDVGGAVDLVVGANLIDRLPSPLAFIKLLNQLVRKDGVVVLTSPYTWLAEYTPKAEWLGGFTGADGKPRSTFEALRSLFTQQGFALVHQSHMPFLIRETGRKHQFTFAHATVWKKA